MAGAAQQQPEGQPVVTDPKKAGEGQIFKGGDVKGEGHDDFQKAREAANEKLRQKQEQDAAAEAQQQEKAKKQAEVEGKASAIVDGIDIEKIAREVDDDFSMAEKFRSFRTMTPEAQTKLKELRERVSTRRQKRIEELLNDPDLNSEIDAALGNTGGQQPPAQPQAPAQPPAGQQAPEEGTPPAQVQEPQKPAQPPQQMDTQQLLDSKLNEIRSEFNDKFEKQQQELEEERVRREEAERKMQEMQNAQKAEQQKQTRTQFDTNAQKLGVPADLLDVAFQKATDIVNSNQRQMSWQEIFAAMKEHFPSLFHGKGATQQPAGGEDEGGQSGEGTGTETKKVAVKAGTGTNAGGKGNPPAQATKKNSDGHDSFADARKSLAERAAKMASGG